MRGRGDHRGLFTTLVRHWVEGDGKEDLTGLYERHLPMPARGLDFQNAVIRNGSAER